MFTKYARFEGEILDTKGSPTQSKTASLAKLSEFNDWNTQDSYLYVRIRAISSRINFNHDSWPTVELAGSPDILSQHQSSEGGFTVSASKDAQYGFSTFLGKPVFVDHNNQDPKRARGVVVDAKFHVDPAKIASLDPFYSSPEAEDYHFPPSWVELLLEIDAKTFPKLAKALIDGSKDPNSGLDGFSMGCFIPGTPITLEDGTQKPIETISLGDQVLTHNGNTEEVVYVMKRPYTGVVYDVETYGQNNHMILTKEHPVWVKRIPTKNPHRKRKWETDGAICLCGRAFDSRRSFGTHLREMRKFGDPAEHTQEAGVFEGWVDAQDLKVGDYLLTPKIHTHNAHPGNYSFARLLGYYVAEGNLMYDRNRFPDGRPVSVEWTLNEDEIEYQQEILQHIDSLGYKGVGPYIKNGSAAIRCNSPELAAHFGEYGGQYFDRKLLHPEVLRWDADNQRALLMAYFNGDGCYEEKHGLHLIASTGSENLARQLHLIAIQSDISMTPPIYQMSPAMIKAGNSPRYVMQAVLEKTERAEKMEPMAFVDEKGLWRRITQMTIKQYEGNVYNFDVEGDDSYVASDIAVHNCNIMKSACNICGNEAEDEYQFCDHIRMKGAQFSVKNPKTGKKILKHSAEKCMGIKYFEQSIVFQPADNTALTQEIISSIQNEGMGKIASNWNAKLGAAPNMLNPTRRCPACGQGTLDPEHQNTCATCGFSDEGAVMASKESAGMDPDPNAMGEERYIDPPCRHCMGVGYINGIECSQCGGTGVQDFSGIYAVPRGDITGLKGRNPEDYPKMPQPLQDALTQIPSEDRPSATYSNVKTAEGDLPQADLLSVPEKVNTLRRPEVCDVCGSEREHNEKCPTCFAPETLVRTKEGYVPICTIEVGDEVLTESGKFEKVLKVFEHDHNGMIYSVQSRAMVEPILVTHDHPIKTLIGHHRSIKKGACSPWRCDRKNAKNANGTIKKTGKHTPHELVFLPVEKMIKDNYVIAHYPSETFDLDKIEVPEQFRGKLRQAAPDAQASFKRLVARQIEEFGPYRRKGPVEFELTPDFLWAIGMYIAEGSNSDRQINYALHANEIEYQERLVNFWSKQGYTAKVIHRPNKPNGAWVEVYSSTLAEWFPAWLGHGCDNKRIPAELFNLPLDKLIHVSQGVLDGDGGKTHTCQFGQTSKILALQMTEIVLRQDRKPEIGPIPLVTTCQREDRKIEYSVAGTSTNVMMKRGNGTAKGTWRWQDKQLVNFRKFEQVPYWGKVYNLQVENDPTYVVQNMLVHNCGYAPPPDSLDNPDLTKSQDMANQNVPPGGTAIEGYPDPQMEAQTPPPATVAPNFQSSASIINEMDWTFYHPKLGMGKINPIERPVLPNGPPATNEPVRETIVSQPSGPITSRTAASMIAAVKQKENNMKTADMPEAATPDASVDVVDVGGVMDASNEEASKADAQVDLLDTGETLAHDVAPDGHESTQTAGPDSDDSGFSTEHTTDGSGPTMTWSLVDTQHAPVTNETLEGDEGVKKSALDAEPFPSDGGPDLAGGGAVSGTEPADPVGKAQERIDVLSPATTPESNNSGPTITWTGTDGNKVQRQHDPVTPETLEEPDGVKKSFMHFVNASRLADMEIEMGVLSQDDKYNRLAALAETDSRIIQTQLETYSKVKTAGLRKPTSVLRTAGTRLPSFGKSASVSVTSSTPNVVDEGLFL